jgi:hypothetical protein
MDNIMSDVRYNYTYQILLYLFVYVYIYTYIRYHMDITTIHIKCYWYIMITMIVVYGVPI